MKANAPLELAFSSSFNPHYVGDYGVACLTLPSFQDAQGYNSFFKFHVPCDIFQHGHWDTGAFPIHDFLINCCRRLKAAQGYAGFSLALPHEFFRWEPYELKLAESYFGLEIDKPANTMTMIDEWRGIKDVNWYTILGEPYVKQLGGNAAIRKNLSDSTLPIYDFGAGLAIRAGNEPEMAPVAKGLPPLYVAVNNVVRPVRTTQIRSMGMGSNAGELRFNIRLTDLWMRRFDAPGIWPPTHP
ncbi:type VI immunity family protein [Paraburkholderia eburnea]|uniref:type VI immunity family protein n=1 Tax=Paraburkholderia eburnea TaxID=1189126 RepID=UPI003134585B